MLAQDFIVRASLDKMPNILILWAFRHYTCAVDLLYSVGKAVVLEIFKKKKSTHKTLTMNRGEDRVSLWKNKDNFYH